ncbi:hypothetical protein B9Z19DRAFT_1131791 [Tuber borchii]|uniref:Uncharacterized protein n=1 Tax=Tuber borchii TaxID=42251 RepID=A0A2T6ZI59_TUBBO|nr:hypothetical protein B9Z19DRAFT_1131791 [Tuber borchii]
MATNVSSGSGGGGEEETLTQTQKEILVELRKSLGTLRVINEILVKTIAVAGGTGGDDSLGGSSGDNGGGGGGLVEAQKEVAREVRRVIGSAVWKGGGDEGEGGSADLPVGAVAEGSKDEAPK